MSPRPHVAPPPGLLQLLLRLTLSQECSKHSISECPTGFLMMSGERRALLCWDPSSRSGRGQGGLHAWAAATLASFSSRGGHLSRDRHGFSCRRTFPQGCTGMAGLADHCPSTLSVLLPGRPGMGWGLSSIAWSLARLICAPSSVPRETRVGKISPSASHSCWQKVGQSVACRGVEEAPPPGSQLRELGSMRCQRVPSACHRSSSSSLCLDA